MGKTYKPGRSHYDHENYVNYTPEPEHQPDKTLIMRKLEVERKRFDVALKENHRGRFIRITEASGGRYNSVVIPEPGWQNFAAIVSELVNDTSS